MSSIQDVLNSPAQHAVCALSDSIESRLRAKGLIGLDLWSFRMTFNAETTDADIQRAIDEHAAKRLKTRSQT